MIIKLISSCMISSHEFILISSFDKITRFEYSYIARLFINIR